ncbi:MAG: sulfite exporter TauE/SafE family protein [Hyphomicrobiales bacterium]|nr:sulfite exporter TauE/SafE family protein [Hyphomicrobiales bacterium]
MITDPLFYAVAVPAVVIMGLAKGGFMGALGMLAVPLMSLVVPPIQAAGILLPILLAMDVFALWAYRRIWDAANLKILIPGAVVGVSIGWFTAEHVSDAHVRLIVGIVALLFSLDYWLARRSAKTGGPRPLAGAFWGAVAGFTSFVSHAGGPPLQMYLLPQRLPPLLFAGTSVIFFAAVNWLKVIPYAALGQFNASNLATSLVLAPLAPISIFAGVWLVRVIKPDLFYRLAYLLVFVVSLKLIWDGVFGIVAM